MIGLTGRAVFLTVVCLVGAIGAPGLAQASSKLTAGAAVTPLARPAAPPHGCPDKFSSTRDPANPLGLAPPPPASDPLRGAQFMVAGPFSDYASNAIVQILGLGGEVGPNKLIKPTTTWADFEQS